MPGRLRLFICILLSITANRNSLPCLVAGGHSVTFLDTQIPPPTPPLRPDPSIRGDGICLRNATPSPDPDSYFDSPPRSISLSLSFMLRDNPFPRFVHSTSHAGLL